MSLYVYYVGSYIKPHSFIDVNYFYENSNYKKTTANGDKSASQAREIPLSAALGRRGAMQDLIGLGLSTCPVFIRSCSAPRRPRAAPVFSHGFLRVKEADLSPLAMLFLQFGYSLTVY